MAYMLDTNICIYLIKRKPARVLDRLRETEIDAVQISSITLSELEYGVTKSSNPGRNRAALIGFLAPLAILDYDEVAAEAYGQIRAHLESLGTPIGPLDTLIAAHALSLGSVLATHNTSEFTRVPGLRVEDWTT